MPVLLHEPDHSVFFLEMREVDLEERQLFMWVLEIVSVSKMRPFIPFVLAPQFFISVPSHNSDVASPFAQ